MGMVIAGAALLIIGIIAGVTLFLLFIATILLLTKHKKAARVLYIISAVPIAAAVVLIAKFSHSARYKEFDTADGSTVIVDMHDVEDMKEYLRKGDLSGVDGLLEKKPELIHYRDVNNVTLLEYGLRNCNTEVMQTAYDHGARFDDKAVFSHLIYSCSLEDFFSLDYSIFLYSADEAPEPRFTKGETTDEIINAAKFAIEHGAAVKWETSAGTYTFSDSVANWVMLDDVRSDKDEELLRLADEAVNK